MDLSLLGVFLFALVGGYLIGVVAGRRSWLEGRAAGRRATADQIRWQHEDPSNTAGA